MNLLPLLHLLAEEPETPVDVAEVNLLLATDEYPNLDVQLHVECLNSYAKKLRSRLQGTLEVQVLELCQYLFGELGFTGNQDDYYDPRNSYMNQVLERRLGIPISLSALAISVGQRAGMDVTGVALPGHFIAKASDGIEEIFFDPFHDGTILDKEDCFDLVFRITGKRLADVPESFIAAKPGEIIVRMLNNLKGIHLDKEDYLRCARIIERLSALLPNDASQKRDLGLCLAQIERHGQAINYLREYLLADPTANDAGAVQKVIMKITAEIAKWN
jgi:regulator of sirC expression with transglutaminase-like and TPR domain